MPRTDDGAFSSDGEDGQRPPPMKCANCGRAGHGYRHCNQPLTSYGILLAWTSPEETRFLVVQRRDSYAFVEFVRGKYEIQDRGYIVNMFASMTDEERLLITTTGFPGLWDALWAGDPAGDDDPGAERPPQRNGNRAEYNESRSKFRRLQRGLRLRTADGDTITLNLPYAAAAGKMASRGTALPEWGFPKGRRNMSGETGRDCALRELREETGIAEEDVDVRPGKPLEEVYTGSNGVRYKHVYYLATVRARGGKPPTMSVCRRELRDAAFLPGETVLSLFSGHPERQELFRRAARACAALRSQSPVKYISRLRVDESDGGR